MFEYLIYTIKFIQKIIYILNQILLINYLYFEINIISIHLCCMYNLNVLVIV